MSIYRFVVLLFDDSNICYFAARFSTNTSWWVRCCI